MGFALLVILVLAAFGGLAWAGNYFFDPTLADIRDVVVIVYGVLGILFFTVLLAVAIGLYFAVRGVAGKVNTLLDEPIRPALDEALETMRNARATSEFYADYAVNPVIKTFAAARGVRKGFASISRIAGRRKG
ncbi:MAG: hypothetical protein IT299_10910 [Dehalococcoidia bacterium]|nr:hypothetical protein [Dehalococcoidia bacterium]